MLPVFWLLLSALPPEPVVRKFPPLELLRDLQDKTASPQSIPLWLRILRLLMVIAIILAISGPVLTPANTDKSDSPLLLVVDDGWASSPDWSKIKGAALSYLTRAEINGQATSLIFTSNPASENQDLGFVSVRKLQQQLKSHEPNPFAPDHGKTAARLDRAKQQGFADSPLQIVWFSDGNDYGQVTPLISQLQEMGDVSILQEPADGSIWINAVNSKPGAMEIELSRVHAASPFSGTLLAEDRTGSILASQTFNLPKQQKSALVSFKLPLEIRNRMGAVRIQNIPSAAAVYLLDHSWSRPRVGIWGDSSRNSDQPLLSERFYLEKALSPLAEFSEIDLNRADISLPSIVILLDTGKLSPGALTRLREYVEAGGFLIRFAGPRLAERQDELIPVPLRTGGRLMGSALGWDQPQQLADFADNSPFFGLDSGSKINVKRQVLAQSSGGLFEHVWARLSDGTPLVTSAKRGNGRIVLFHVTASADWSELPMSGVFVQMLKRLLPMASSPADTGEYEEKQTSKMQLQMALAANGQLQVPDARQAILDVSKKPITVSAELPAGLWANSKHSLALNVLDNLNVQAFPPVPDTVSLGNMEISRPIQLAGGLLFLALIILIVDNLAILMLAGKLPILRKYAAVLSVALAMTSGLVIMQPTPAQAEDYDPFKVIEQTRLAYVITGRKDVDRLSKAGLHGLSRELYLRTTVEPAQPVGINLEQDDLNVISVLYWPLLEPANLSEQAAIRINTYLKNGGMLVIDTQDGGLRAVQAGGIDPALRALALQIDIPSIQKIPDDHVLTRTYYLIQSFPGRYTGAPIWVESSRKGSALDGVSSLVIGANDWAAAWAVTEDGQALAAVSGEIEQQRELSRRFGINLVMYVLAGNYKADQVHIPALLERLNQ